MDDAAWEFLRKHNGRDERDPQVDVSVLECNLRLSPDERLAQLEGWVELVRELRGAGRRIHGPDPRTSREIE